MAPTRRILDFGLPKTPRSQKKPYIKQTPTGLGVRAHGNWCGPNWSGGEFQGSVEDENVPSVDTLDELCRQHDGAYARRGSNLLEADVQFAQGAVFEGFQGLMFSAAVAGQALGRAMGILPRTFDPAQVTTETDCFPILKIMPKYARRRTRRGVRKYAKKNRKTFKSKRKSNKRAAKYRRRSTRRNRRVGYSKVNNSVLRYEAGGTLDDPNAVYLGHGTPTRQLARTFFMSMVRQLLAKYGITFTEWDEEVFKLNNTGPDFDLALFWNYGPQEHIAWKESSILVLPTATYYTLADDLLSKFCADYKAAMDAVDIQYQPVFNKMVLYKGTGEETENYELASIELRNMKVNYYYSSSLRLQNQTAAGTNGAVTDVNNVNPLEGKVYFGPKNKNYFPLKYKAPSANDQDYKGWTPHVTHGYIRDLAKYHPEKLFEDLPGARDVHAISTKKFALHPGQIVVDKITHRHTAKIDTFLKNLQNEWTTPTWHGTNLGTCRVMGFEKLLADRSFAPAPGPVKVAWEVNYSVSCSISHYNVPANARVTVVSTPV